MNAGKVIRRDVVYYDETSHTIGMRDSLSRHRVDKAIGQYSNAIMPLVSSKNSPRLTDDILEYINTAIDPYRVNRPVRFGLFGVGLIFRGPYKITAAAVVGTIVKINGESVGVITDE